MHRADQRQRQQQRPQPVHDSTATRGAGFVMSCSSVEIFVSPAMPLRYRNRHNIGSELPVDHFSGVRQHRWRRCSVRPPSGINELTGEAGRPVITPQRPDPECQPLKSYACTARLPRPGLRHARARTPRRSRSSTSSWPCTPTCSTGLLAQLKSKTHLQHLVRRHRRPDFAIRYGHRLTAMSTFAELTATRLAGRRHAAGSGRGRPALPAACSTR